VCHVFVSAAGHLCGPGHTLSLLDAQSDWPVSMHPEPGDHRRAGFAVSGIWLIQSAVGRVDGDEFCLSHSVGMLECQVATMTLSTT